MAHMPDLLDLRQFRAAALAPLLAAEMAEWEQRLEWDYRGSTELIRQYIEARILHGYVLIEREPGRARPLGYGFYLSEGHKGMIGNLFVDPAARTPEYGQERYLLAPMLETLGATPGLDRIEAQLMPFPPTALGAVFAAAGYTSYRRIFLRRDLGGAALEPRPAPAGLRLERWGSAGYEEAARLIQRAYARHVDSRINDQYRSFAGAVRFLQNIANYPGCGVFDPEASFLARALGGGLEGMILTSRVKPDVAHITQVCVLPERQHHGLGRCLVVQCLAALAAQGLGAATLTVTAENHGARALYERLGFAPMHEFDAYVWDRHPQAEAGA